MGRREQYPADVKELPSEFGMLSDSEQEIKDTVKYEEGLFKETSGIPLLDSAYGD